MLKKLKNQYDDKDLEAGGFEQQPSGIASSSGNFPAQGESSGKESINYRDSTEVQPFNTFKVKMVLYVSEDGDVMSMVDVDEIEEGEFVDHSLTKENIPYNFI